MQPTSHSYLTWEVLIHPRGLPGLFPRYHLSPQSTRCRRRCMLRCWRWCSSNSSSSNSSSSSVCKYHPLNSLFCRRCSHSSSGPRRSCSRCCSHRLSNRLSHRHRLCCNSHCCSHCFCSSIRCNLHSSRQNITSHLQDGHSSLGAGPFQQGAVLPRQTPQELMIES